MSDTIMRDLPRIALLALTAALAGCSDAVDPSVQQPERFPSPAAEAPEYRIGPGDQLSVILPFNPELNYEGPVGPDGRFTMPVAGTIVAAGKTVSEAQAGIDQALADRHIVRAAQSSISIRLYGQVIYVGGEVKSQMDPLQAITVAGGMLDTARTAQVVVIRRGPDGHPILRVVDLDAFIHGGSMTDAVALQPQDTVFVPKSSIAEVDLWIDQYINKPLPFGRSLSYTINQNSTGTVSP